MINKLFGNKDSKSFYVEDQPKINSQPRKSRKNSSKASLASNSQTSFTEKYHSAARTDNKLRLTYDSASPENIDLVIAAVYKQVFGNNHLMESERSPQLESQLRSGRINVKEFISSLAKSDKYRALFLDKNSNLKTVELNFKHFLGRAPKNRQEISQHIQILAEEGLEAEIDSYFDSEEYQENFGNAIVPFARDDKSPKTNKKIASKKIDSLSVLKAGSQNVARNAIRSTSFSRPLSAPVASAPVASTTPSYTRQATPQSVTSRQPVSEIQETYAEGPVSEKIVQMAKSMLTSSSAPNSGRRAVKVSKKFMDMARNLPYHLR